MSDLFELFGQWWYAIVPVLFFVLEALGLYSAWHAINYARTSQAAVAWAVALIVIPIITLPLYWIFGRTKFDGYREAIREVEKRHKQSVDSVRKELLTNPNLGAPASRSPLARLADVLDTPLSEGNRFELLIDGEPFFEAMFAQIEAAEKYIYIEFFIIRDDEIGRRFADALCTKAASGVTVRLLYDEVGCLKLAKTFLQKLRDAGVDVHAFNTRQGWTNRFQLNFRNHRKLLVVDGKRAIIGGLNVGDEYLGRGWASHWRDTGISIDGPASKKIQAVFAADYYWALRNDIPEAIWSHDAGEGSAEPLEANANSPNSGEAVVCATGPADLRNRATMMFAAAANESKSRLWISSPYLVPDESSITAISMAKARGVDVRILIPDRVDHWLVYLAGFYYERMFEELGIDVYRYPDGFLHQKCVLVDDTMVLIGSTNLDNRSLHLNFELMVAGGDPKLVADATAMLEKDFQNAKKTDRESSRLIPWYIRLGTVVARLFSPVL